MSEAAGSQDGDEQVRYRGTDRLGGTLVVTDRRILVGEDAARFVGDSAGGAENGDHDEGAVDSDEGGVDSDESAVDGEAGSGEADTDGDVVSIPLESVSELTEQSFDWFLFLMDAAIIGFGLLSLERTLVVGVAFIAAGVISLGLTYRRRGRVRIHTHTRPKPVDTYPSAPAAFLDAVDAALAPIREEQPPAGETETSA